MPVFNSPCVEIAMWKKLKSGLFCRARGRGGGFGPVESESAPLWICQRDKNYSHYSSTATPLPCEELRLWRHKWLPCYSLMQATLAFAWHILISNTSPRENELLKQTNTKMWDRVHSLTNQTLWPVNAEIARWALMSHRNKQPQMLFQWVSLQWWFHVCEFA